MTLYAKETNLLYHGTRAVFDVFRPLSHFGSLEAAEQILMFPTQKKEIVTARHEMRVGMMQVQTPIDPS